LEWAFFISKGSQATLELTEEMKKASDALESDGLYVLTFPPTRDLKSLSLELTEEMKKHPTR